MTIRNSLWRSASLVVLLAPLALMGCKTQGGGTAAASGGGGGTPTTEQDKIFYSLGNQLGTSIKPFALTPAEFDMVRSGLSDAVFGNKSKVEGTEFQMKVRQLYMERSKAASEKVKEAGKKFAEDAGKQPGAVVTPSGMVYLSLKPGSGESPVAQDRVKVNYEGKLIDGTVFDSSYKRNQPAEFPLNGVIPCWTEGLQKMKVGEKARLTCPSTIGYGDRGSPPNIPGGATLSFEVELISIDKSAAMAPQAPGGGAPGGMPGMPGGGGRLQLGGPGGMGGGRMMGGPAGAPGGAPRLQMNSPQITAPSAPHP